MDLVVVLGALGASGHLPSRRAGQTVFRQRQGCRRLAFFLHVYLYFVASFVGNFANAVFKTLQKEVKSFFSGYPVPAYLKSLELAGPAQKAQIILVVPCQPAGFGKGYKTV